MSAIVQVLILALAAGSSQAATLAWDHPKDEVSYKVFLDGVEVADVPTRSAEVTLPPGGGVYTVRAYLGYAHSAPSEPLTVPAAPSSVKLQIEW